jgi:hypothetical protein
MIPTRQWFIDHARELEGRSWLEGGDAYIETVDPAPPRPEDIAASGDELAAGDSIVTFIERRDWPADPKT